MSDRKLTILLIDDNHKFAKRMAILLKELAITGEVKIALDYEEAKRMLETEIADLVLLDIHIKGKSGIDLLKFIKSKGLVVKVMMVSNETHDYYKTVCMKLGADYFFDKTNEISLILDVIRNLKTL